MTEPTPYELAPERIRAWAESAPYLGERRVGVLALLDRVEQLEAENERLKEALIELAGRWRKEWEANYLHTALKVMTLNQEDK